MDTSTPVFNNDLKTNMKRIHFQYIGFVIFVNNHYFRQYKNMPPVFPE